MSYLSGPLILFYNSFFGYWPDTVRLNFETTCRFTTDRRRLAEADVVVFHLPSMAEAEYPERVSGQRWVAWSKECIENTPPLADRDFMAQFDFTIGYWREASVWTPYFDSNVAKNLRLAPIEKTEIAPAVYFQSSTVDKSGRLELVRALMKHFPVDSYGKALNNRQLPGPDDGFRTKRAIIARYKFTLAFENAISKDYVTEKFFDPLIAGSVPVYLGAPNIAEFAPGEGCFINVADFDGPARLAAYLERLCTDDAAYGRYLAWKDHPLRPQFLAMATAVNSNSMHRLCAAVKGRPGQDGLAAIGRLTNQPLVRALLRPVCAFFRRLAKSRLKLGRR